jgi:hypothetical protein
MDIAGQFRVDKRDSSYYLQNRFLKLSTLLSVLGNGSPVTIDGSWLAQAPFSLTSAQYLLSPVIQSSGTDVDHGLNSENLTGFHFTRSFGSTVMYDVRVAMELWKASQYQSFCIFQVSTDQLVDSVTSVLSNDTEAFWLNDRLDLVSDISIQDTRFTDSDSAIGGFFGRGHQGRGLLVNLSNWVGGVQVPVETTVV